MTIRNFNNVTTIGSLTGPIAASAVSVTVQNFTGYPATPFTVTIDRNTPTEEICLVTGVAGSTLTVTRGYDGTAAQAHSAGATIEHTAGGIEYQEANTHVNATQNVHGVTGGLVGAEGAQSIYDKTLVSPVLQADVAAGDAAVAYIPSGAETKNLFRGVNSGGSDVVTVDSSGNLNAQSLASTGDTNVHGNLTVNGTGTVTGLLSANGGVTVPTGKKVTLTDAPTSGTHAANKTYVDGAVSPKANTASPTFTGKITAPQLDLTNTGDASATTDGALVIGSRTSYNTTIDNNEIVFRNNGTVTGNVASTQYVDSKFSDTGWTALTPAPGVTPGARGMNYRVLNGVVYLSVGAVAGSSGWQNGAVVATLPVGARPANQTTIICSILSANQGEVTISTAGVISCANTLSNTANAGITFSGSFAI